PIRSCDVTNVAAYPSSSVNRFSIRSDSLVPNGSKEIDLQIDAGEALSFSNSREMSRTNRRIGNVTQDSAMNRSNGIRMDLGLSFHLEGSGAFTDVNELESQSLHNRKREIEWRLIH